MSNPKYHTLSLIINASKFVLSDVYHSPLQTLTLHDPRPIHPDDSYNSARIVKVLPQMPRGNIW